MTSLERLLKDDIKQMKLLGVKHKEIARVLDVSKKYIDDYVNRMKIKKNEPIPTNSLIRKIKNLIFQGYTFTDISNKLNCSKNLVSKIKKKIKLSNNKLTPIPEEKIVKIIEKHKKNTEKLKNEVNVDSITHYKACKMMSYKPTKNLLKLIIDKNKFLRDQIDTINRNLIIVTKLLTKKGLNRSIRTKTGLILYISTILNQKECSRILNLSTLTISKNLKKIKTELLKFTIKGD